MTVRHFIAAKAFIQHHGKVLILRESGGYTDGTHQGCYDVCGGRIDPRESILSGLAREVAEETGLTLKLDTAQLFFTNNATVQKHGETWHITRHFFTCEALNDQITLSADHDDAQWITPNESASFSVIGNLIPAFEAYANWVKQQ